MADTQRTLAAILALVPDNVTKDTSPQDIRDAIVSIFNNFASITADGSHGNQTTNAVGGTPDKVVGFTHDGADEGTVAADVANDKLTVSVDGFYAIVWNVSFLGSTNTNYTGHIYVNGADLPNVAGEWFRGIGTSAQYGNATAFAFVAVSAGQDIEAYIEANGNSKNFNMASSFLGALKIG